MGNPSRLGILCLLFCGGPLAAQAVYFVNARTGQDILGNGTSAGTPWRSITYALSQISPPAGPETAKLIVEGNCIYSRATTRESFPLTPIYNLWIEGTQPGGILPAIVADPGNTILSFAPNETYQRNAVTLRNLAFDGGAYGVTMGSASGKKHAPRFWGCIFRNHSVAGVSVRGGASSTNDPRFFQCTFQNSGRGIEMFATAVGSIVYPDIEENTFTNITNPTTGEAIYLEDTSGGGGAVGAQIRSNWFDHCARGVKVISRLQGASTNFRVFSCSFRDITYEGLWVDVLNDPSATIEDSSFVRCQTGVLYSGILAPGPYVLDLRRCAIRNCSMAGVSVSMRGSASLSINLEDCLLEACDRGLVVATNSSTLQMAATLHRVRALRNRIGVDFSGLTSLAAGSVVQVTSSLVCDNSAIGVSLNTSSVGQSTLRCLTVADNKTGIQIQGAAPLAIDHTIFANNTTNVSASYTPTIQYSCFDTSSWPVGIGNLNNTNPQLIRPFYKIATSSPCIDKGNVATLLPATDYEGDPRKGLSKFGGSLVPDIGADEYLLFGSANKYGVRGFGTYNFFPEIGVVPAGYVIGGSITITLSGAIQPFPNTPATSAALVFGGRDDSGTLPFELSAFGAPGSLLWNDLLWVAGFVPVSATGTAWANLPIPPALALVGQTVTFQWHAFLPGVTPAGAVTSDGLRVTFG